MVALVDQSEKDQGFITMIMRTYDVESVHQAKARAEQMDGGR